MIWVFFLFVSIYLLLLSRTRRNSPTDKSYHLQACYLGHTIFICIKFWIYVWNDFNKPGLLSKDSTLKTHVYQINIPAGEILNLSKHYAKIKADLSVSIKQHTPKQVFEGIKSSKDTGQIIGKYCITSFPFAEYAKYRI